MSAPEVPSERIIETLRERAKELHCLYRVHEILSHADAPVPEICRSIVEALPPGWQFSGDCFARIAVGNDVYQPPRVTETPWVQHADILAAGKRLGAIDVFYTQDFPAADEGPFLKEERKLIDTIAARIGEFAIQRGLAGNGERVRARAPDAIEWPVIVEFLKRTDAQLLSRVSRRMMNHLGWMGIERAQALLASYASTARDRDEDALDDNRPLDRSGSIALPTEPEDIFGLAAEHLDSHEILAALEKWIRDDKGGFLIEAADHQSSSLGDIADALDRFQGLAIDDSEISRSTQVALRVALARRLLTDDPEFIRTAKDYIAASDYATLMHRVIAPLKSHGKLGGKAAGLILASEIVRKSNEYADVLGDVRTPRTWYIASDALLDFVEYNHLEDVYNRKYFEIAQIRRDYPHVVQVFKHSHFPPEIVKGLSVALDEFQDRPLIVRSSSLLEDRMGSAFSGKYKSLFLANQGSKRERLGALMDAVAEVYASLFGPDPIEYRTERGLIHFHEEMAVMIQEVVGSRVGRYFLPAYSGVAFSTNELRWSPRIRREDGLLRMVAGLGTRAVDRLADDYPVLIAPGQPGLRVNISTDDVMRYSPHKMDLIDLEARRFETMEIAVVLKACGRDFPVIGQIASVLDSDGRRRTPGFTWNPDRETTVVTFDGLIDRTAFIPQIRALLRLLREKLGFPVDIEFASDGQNLYLLQCRAQSFSEYAAPAVIPRDVPRDRIVFSANRYVTNGSVPDLTHIVYVDPDRYQALSAITELRDVGRAVGRLNALLPKRQFALLGPGRWGSRGDIRLGVSVGYSDISNTALLLEVARKRGHYVPDVSFGTHFFQDLVESGIRYLPLYPDDKDVVFNESFLSGARNLLVEMVPEHARLADVIRVIDVPQATGGLVLRVLMNADEDEAVGVLVPAEAKKPVVASSRPVDRTETSTADHWSWRLLMAQKIAAEADAARFGIKAMYVFGSTKNATAGPASDIDLLVHLNGTEAMRHDLEMWLDGWSRALSEINYLRTGARTDGLLDVHIVTDEDVEKRTSYAAKIGAVTDGARPLSTPASS
jgi:pyruvate,water dikinase